MALAREQVVLFRTLMRALLGYARPPQAPLLDTDISQALDMLWSTPAPLERFIAQNPAGLNASQLEMVAAWRHRLTDTFVCLEVTPELLTVMNGERIFDVAATGQPLTSMVTVVPSIVRLTLLPFAGHIVTDGRVIHRLDHLDPAAFPLIMDTLSLLGEDGIMETGTELIEYAASRMVSS